MSVVNMYPDDPEYMKLINAFGKYFTGTNMKKLKFLLTGTVNIDTLTKEKVMPLDFFNELAWKGFVAPNELKMFMDIARLTECKMATNLLKKYAAANDWYLANGRGVLPYRHSLYKALTDTTSDDFLNARAYHDLTKYEDTIKDIWDIVLYLEKEKDLATREQLNTFADHLCGRAKATITDALSVLVTTNEDTRTFDNVRRKTDKLVDLVMVQPALVQHLNLTDEESPMES